MEIVKISKTLMTRLKEKQKKQAANKVTGIWMELLGCDANGVVIKGVPLWDGEPNEGCGFAPHLTVEAITNPTVDLIKQGLTPCGLLRIHRYSPDNSSISTNLTPTGGSFLQLCAPGKLKMFTMGVNALFEITQYTDCSGVIVNHFQYELVDEVQEAELDKS